MLCPFLSFLMIFQRFVVIFEFFLRQISALRMPSVLGRRDGSIRASRKRRSRNKTDNCPLPKLEWATTTATTATEEFSQGIQAPSSTHPWISYPVRANPSLRYFQTYDNYIYFKPKLILKLFSVIRLAGVIGLAGLIGLDGPIRPCWTHVSSFVIKTYDV